ncbi:MAG: hypothetical protein ACD_43C00185G0001, partial [uncultured bacterium]
ARTQVVAITNEAMIVYDGLIMDQAQVNKIASLPQTQAAPAATTISLE